MRKDYETVTDITEVDKKLYLLKINHNKTIQNKLYACMTNKQIKQLLQNYHIYQELFYQAIDVFYQSQNYDELEYHCIMLNHIFKQQDLYKIKKDLFQKITKHRITLDEYCVIRHLIDMKHLHFEYIIHLLHNHYHVDDEECARICLLENQSHLAYIFLKEQDECQNAALLDLLRSYSLCDYLSLIKHYSKKQRLVMESIY